jgi:hypothetical protein
MRQRIETGFNAATEGNSVEGLENLRWLAPRLYRFNAATEGNSVESKRRKRNTVAGKKVVSTLQCGHGGELRGKVG